MRFASFVAVMLAAHCLSEPAVAATVDTSFNFTGQARDYLDLGTSQADLIADVAIAPSTGSFYTVGRVEHVEAYGPTFGVMFKRLSNGEKDTTFFNGNSPASRVLIPAERSGGSSALNAVAFDSSYRGAVLLAGFNDLSNGKRCGVVYKVLDRLAAKGPFDSSFGTAGRYAYCSIHSADTVFNDIKVLPDGRAVVVGTSSTTSGEKYPFILRLTTAGTLDVTFSGGGSDGVLAFDVRAGKDDAGLRLAIGTQGYYIAGNSTFARHIDPQLFGDDIDLWVARIKTQGVVDTGFNGNGKRVEAIDLPYSDKTDLLADIAVDAAGRPVLLGNVNPAHLFYDNQGNYDWNRTNRSMGVLIRLTASGARDSTFATNGMATLALPSVNCWGPDFCDYDEPIALLTLPDNRILVAGRYIPTGPLSSTPPSLMTLRTVSSDGQTSSSQRFTQWPRSEGGPMVRQADGKFLIGGQVRTSFNLADLDFALTRFLAP